MRKDLGRPGRSLERLARELPAAAAEADAEAAIAQARELAARFAPKAEGAAGRRGKDVGRAFGFDGAALAGPSVALGSGLGADGTGRASIRPAAHLNRPRGARAVAGGIDKLFGEAFE